MRIVATVLTLGAALVCAPLAEPLGPAEAAALSVAVGVLVAIIVAASRGGGTTVIKD